MLVLCREGKSWLCPRGWGCWDEESRGGTGAASLTLPLPGIARDSLKVCSIQVCISLHLYPHCSPLRCFIHDHWQIVSLDTIICGIHTCAMCNFWYAFFAHSCVRENSAEGEEILPIFVLKSPFVFSPNEGYMLLKAMVSL